MRQTRFEFWKLKRKPRLLSHAVGADVFRVGDCIVSFNAREGHWTVRRRGQIIGSPCETVAQATALARQTRETRETAQKELL